MQSHLFARCTESLVNRLGAHFGAADTHIDHVSNRVASATTTASRANVVGKGAHMFERLLHFLVKRRPHSRISQRSVQSRTAFARVDNLAFSHSRIRTQNPLFPGNFQKRIEISLRHTLPPDIKRQSAGGKSGSGKRVAQKRNGIGSHVFIFGCSSVARNGLRAPHSESVAKHRAKSVFCKVWKTLLSRFQTKFR